MLPACHRVTITGCATRPAERTEYTKLQPLESGWSRIYVSAGRYAGVKLWSVHQVGPVFVDDQHVGNTAKDEHFVVDLRLGSYEEYCEPEQPDRNRVEKRQFRFNAGETYYLSCEMSNKGVGIGFGMVGAIFSKYLTKSYLAEKTMSDPDSKLVAYKRLQPTPLNK